MVRLNVDYFREPLPQHWLYRLHFVWKSLIHSTIMFWTILNKGDGVIQFTAALLILASAITWALIVYKSVVLAQLHRAVRAAPARFWDGDDFEHGANAMAQADGSGVLVDVLRDAVMGVKSQGVGAHVPLEERLNRLLRERMDRVQLRLDTGMTALATITSAAPFIGLFGTVWGIYGALVGLSQGADTGLLDKISGPIGEALIMTAVGLAVAIPALVAYNLFARWTRLLRQDVEGFVTDMHGYAIHNVQQLAMVDLKPRAATKISSGEKG